MVWIVRVGWMRRATNRTEPHLNRHHQTQPDPTRPNRDVNNVPFRTILVPLRPKTEPKHDFCMALI